MPGCAEMMGGSSISCSLNAFEMLWKFHPTVFFPEVTRDSAGFSIASAEENRMFPSSGSTQLHASPKFPGFVPAPFYCVTVQEHLSPVDCMWVHSLRGIWGRRIC